MQIKIIRKRTNRLYTEGELTINGKYFAATIESTETMSNSGVYNITGRVHNHIGHGNSWIESRKLRKILIGESLFPGIVIGSRPLYNRLVDRAKKSTRPISLIITDDQCQSVPPISHWKANCCIGEARNTKLTLIFVFLFLLTGCSSLHRVQVAKHATHDTLYINTLKYDSIYIDRQREVEIKPATAPRSSAAGLDTILIREKEREYRYQFLHDTMRIVKNDTIPVVHTIEKPVKYVPAFYKWSLGISIALLILLILYFVWKIFL